MTPALEHRPVLVVGAGIMGSGIAQVAALAGHPVMLFDLRPGVAQTAKDNLAATFDKLVARGKFDAATAGQALDQVSPLERIDEAASVGLVVEAIVEDLDTKRGLFQQLETVIAEDCVLATNTSSLSVTAIANGLAHPQRLVGMHFFNPVPLMKLVEVVSGLQTDCRVAEAIFELAGCWGKVAVHARSTPGFIVNRIARPFYAETLALLQEQAGTPDKLDACLRGAGFRMGPCELMDLIGHDTNFAVTRSVYEANFFDKRFTPSLVQQALVEGGLLGRKSGRGFYEYPRADDTVAAEFEAPETLPPASSLEIHGAGAVAQRLADLFDKRGIDYRQVADSDWTGLQADGAQLRETDGRPASQLGAEVALFDRALGIDYGATLAWSHSTRASQAWVDAAKAWLQAAGFRAVRIADTPGLVAARTVAMLINEAADAVQQGVCNAQDADSAMKLGVNYPAGPFEWLQDWGAQAVIDLLDRLDDYYRGERYRVSPWLRQQTWRQH